MIRFETHLKGEPGGPTGIEVPASVIEQLGAGKKPPVCLTVNGYAYRSTVAVMGGAFMIPFSSEHRTKSGLAAGDAIVVEIEVDLAPRTVEVPEDLAQALAAGGKKEAFEKLAPAHKKEHVRYVNEAKALETRLRRIEKTVASL